jgi:hypothetical protein
LRVTNICREVETPKKPRCLQPGYIQSGRINTELTPIILGGTREELFPCTSLYT